MPISIKQEFGRKTVHIFSALIIVMFLGLFPESQRLPFYLLAVLLVVTIELEYMRVETKFSSPLMNFIRQHKRTKEKQHLGGDAFFLIGAIIALSIYDLWIAVIAIFMTTFGDLVASIVGRCYGKHRISRKIKKTWEGTLTEFIVNILIGLLVVGPLAKFYPIVASSLSQSQWIIPTIVIMALTATFVEVVVSKLDDNLLIPLFSGFNGQLFVFLVGLTITVH